MMYDDILSLLQESIVRWHKLLIISWTKSFKSQNNIKFQLCFIHVDCIEDEAKDLLLDNNHISLCFKSEASIWAIGTDR